MTAIEILTKNIKGQCEKNNMENKYSGTTGIEKNIEEQGAFVFENIQFNEHSLLCVPLIFSIIQIANFHNIKTKHNTQCKKSKLPERRVHYVIH